MSLFYVKIFYGPYKAFFDVSHKPQKVKGLRDHLRKLGYRVDLVPVEFINYCMLEMCGYEVFRCNITNLNFNTPHSMDPVCKRAVDAVLSATEKFKRAKSYIYFWTLLEDQLFRRSKYAPRDQWKIDTSIGGVLANCQDCIECCGLLTEDVKEPAVEKQEN